MELSYKDLLESAVKKGEKCPEGFKRCGILYSFDNIMCIKKEGECPINLVVINNDKNAPTGNYAYTTVKLDSLYLHYTNEAIDDYVVSKFINKETLKIDVSPFNINANENKDFFIANSCDINSTKDTNATFYKNVGNDIFIRPFTGAKPQCSDFYNETKFISDFKYKNTIELVTFIIELVTTFESFVYLEILIKHEDVSYLLIILSNAVHLMLITTSLVLNVFLISLTKKVCPNKECFDEFTYNMFSNTDKEHDIGLYMKIGGYALWIFIEIITYIIYLIYCLFFVEREDEDTNATKTGTAEPLKELPN